MAKGRPPLNPGTYGEIWVSDNGKPYKARARYRDRDGITRTVARFGQTKRAARDKLRAALADRQRDTGTGIRSSFTVAELAHKWLADVQESDRAANTKDTYRYAVDRIIARRLGGLRLVEVDTPIIDEALAGVRLEIGPGAAKTTRAVLNGMFGLAIRHGAMTINPVRETARIGSGRRKTPRALTVAEADDLSDRLRTEPRAVLLDLPDLVDWMLGTGCRVGEALAVREDSLDLDAGTVAIDRTVTRIKGRGLMLERPKTPTSNRVLVLPGSLVEMAHRRRTELRFSAAERVLFPSPFAPTLRDPSNLAGELREVLDRLGYDWITSHTFRKTVATRLDEAGQSSRQVADQLGHAQPSLTQNVYLGRGVANPDAARILDR